MALSLISGKIEGEYLYITLQGDGCEEVNSASARQLAYTSRHKYGFGNAGIDTAGGPFVVDLAQDDPQNPGSKGREVLVKDMAEISKRKKDIGYRQVFRLTRSLA